MSQTDLLSDDEVETLTYQILKFFHEDPLTPDELTDQLFWAAKWGTEAKQNRGLLHLVLKGELAMGFDRETGELKFKKLPPNITAEPAPIADLDDDDDDDDDELEWWEA